MEDNFTIGSEKHNAGKGLGNIRRSCTQNDRIWIISNEAAVVMSEDQQRIIRLGYNFAGTLIFYSMSLSHFEDEEKIDDFVWD